MIIIVKRSC